MVLVSHLKNNISGFEDVCFFLFLSFWKLLPTLTTCLQVSFQYNFEKQNEASQMREAVMEKSNSFLNEDDEVGTILLETVSEFKT